MPAPERPTLEVCVDTVAGITACSQHVDRIELCSALALGGLTPSPGLFAAVATSPVPVHAMIRPRGGGFTYDAAEQDACVADIIAARAAGCAGVVIGAAKDGGLDRGALGRYVEAANGMVCTLHRVIDVLDDPSVALEDAVSLGITRILTSGGAPSAGDGIAVLAALQAQARGRIAIMAGSGVSEANLSQISKATGIRHFHSSCSARAASDPRDVSLGFAPAQQSVTDTHRIAKLRTVLDQI